MLFLSLCVCVCVCKLFKSRFVAFGDMSEDGKLFSIPVEMPQTNLVNWLLIVHVIQKAVPSPEFTWAYYYDLLDIVKPKAPR